MSPSYGERGVDKTPAEPGDATFQVRNLAMEALIGLIDDIKAAKPVKDISHETGLPLAMAEAFRSGNFGVMDYYKMQNVQADTGMRQSISGAGQSGIKKE